MQHVKRVDYCYQRKELVEVVNWEDRVYLVMVVLDLVVQASVLQAM